jgi:hypothetical protein
MERKSAAFSKWAVRKDVTSRKSVWQVLGIRRDQVNWTAGLQKQVEQNISARVKQFFIELRTVVKSAGRLARAGQWKMKSLQELFSFNVSINMLKPARGWHEDKAGRTGFQRQGKLQLNANLVQPTLNPKVTYASLYTFRVHKTGSIEPADGGISSARMNEISGRIKRYGFERAWNLWGSSVQVRVEPGDKGYFARFSPNPPAWINKVRKSPLRNKVL